MRSGIIGKWLTVMAIFELSATLIVDQFFWLEVTKAVTLWLYFGAILALAVLISVATFELAVRVRGSFEHG